MDEFDIITRYFEPLAKSAEGSVETFSLQDDAALLSSKKPLVITTDAIVKGVHFFGFEAPDLIAKKALRTNLSDLASKGALPLGYTMTLHLSGDVDENWLKGFCEGLAADQQEFGIKLLGGDTVKSDTLAVSITAFGEAADNYPSRLDAKIGDDIWLTGTIGDASLGLRLFDGRYIHPENEHENEHIDYLKNRYLLPRPRIEIAPILKFAHASMDVSDGLLGDLAKLMNASDLSACLNAEQIPLSKAALWAMQQNQFSGAPMQLHHSLFEGDDYEVLFTAPTGARDDIEALGKHLSFKLSRIGEISSRKGQESVCVVDKKGASVFLDATAHTHKI